VLLQTVEIEGKTYALVQDGRPLYKAEDGKDVAFDAPGTVATISRLNGEAKGHREAKEAAETKLKAFEGLDAAAARDAIDKLSKIDAKKLVEAGDMDAAVQAAIKPYADKLATAETAVGDLTGKLNKAVIGSRFAQSKYAAEKLTPAGVDLIRTIYGDRLKVEGDQLYGVDQAGAKLFSKARPGEVADFDEVIEAFVESYPHKDHILKGSGHQGSGKDPNSNGGGGAKQMSRAEFGQLDAQAQMAKMRDGFTVVD